MHILMAKINWTIAPLVRKLCDFSRIQIPAETMWTIDERKIPTPAEPHPELHCF